MKLSSLSSSDPGIYNLIKKELSRQKNVLENTLEAYKKINQL